MDGGVVLSEPTGPMWDRHVCECPSDLPLSSIRLLHAPDRLPTTLAMVGAIWQCGGCRQQWIVEEFPERGYWRRISRRSAQRRIRRREQR